MTGVQEGNSDFDIVANKLEFANDSSAKVAECEASYGADEINGAKAIIDDVDVSQESVDVALGQVDSFLRQHHQNPFQLNNRLEVRFDVGCPLDLPVGPNLGMSEESIVLLLR